jgi:hypothetical protein
MSKLLGGYHVRIDYVVCAVQVSGRSRVFLGTAGFAGTGPSSGRRAVVPSFGEPGVRIVQQEDAVLSGGKGPEETT